MRQQHSIKGRYVGATVALFSVALLAKTPIAQADTTGQTTDQTSAVKATSASTQSAVTLKSTTDTTSAAATSSSSTAASASSQSTSSATSASTQSSAKSATTSQAIATKTAASAATSAATTANSAASATSSSASSSATAKKTANVTVNYVNKRTGKTIHAAKVLTGTVGQTYDASKTAVTVDGYTLSQQPTNLTGTYSADTTLTWVYAPKKVTVTVDAYWYNDENDPDAAAWWDSYDVTGYVGDTITVKAADYSDDELALDDDASTQTITLKAKDNVVEFYYDDTTEYDEYDNIEDYEDIEQDVDDFDNMDNVESSTILEDFKDLTIGTVNVDNKLFLVGNNHADGSAVIIAWFPGEDQQTYDVTAANGETEIGWLNSGVNTITIGGETYKLSWGSKIVTVYRQLANGQVMGYEVDATTGEILNAYVSSRPTNGQWQVWQRNFQTNTTTTTQISADQAKQLAQCAALTATAKTVAHTKQVATKAQAQNTAKTLPQTGEQRSGRAALIGGALLAVAGLAWIGLRKH
ncbi:LPXTG cell wall anchor domain-containing protein [Lactiplantibacillus herbarum]|uniref:LPXTG cell wall anchor domain-containing protein n=1 Tax=Lactiplantibacillus herbarum TaxID=1670446 RepID=UPI00069F8B9C|nr:LPXTG cell wall anchor domain-containing protein [Lactiplantibacillus herbarum]